MTRARGRQPVVPERTPAQVQVLLRNLSEPAKRVLRLLVDAKEPVQAWDLVGLLDAQEVGRSSRSEKHVTRTLGRLKDLGLARETSWRVWDAEDDVRELEKHDGRRR